MTAGYRGRFAPSPTGPLHFGSLVAAVGSYLQARSQDGLWLVRIENLDPPRESPTAIDQILRTLEYFHLYWDEDVLYQSERHPAYTAALKSLEQRGFLYYCTCSRKDLRIAQPEPAADPELGVVYPGTCRSRQAAPRQPHCIRIRTNSDPIVFADVVQGRFEQNVERTSGDFVLKRRDGLFSYQIAVVVDDAAQGISEVVRGIDLLGQTARQIFLQQVLGLPAPAYAHLPIVVDTAGNKLSKQTGAIDVRAGTGHAPLWQALKFLRQNPPPELYGAPAAELLEWATPRWTIQRLAGVQRGTIHGINDNPSYDV